MEKIIVWYVPGYGSPTFNKQKAEILKNEQEDNRKLKSIKDEWKKLFKQSQENLEWLFEDAKIKIIDEFNEDDSKKDVRKAISIEAERIAQKILDMKVEKRLEIVLLGDHDGADVVIEVMKLLGKFSSHFKIRQYILLQPNLKHLSECFEYIISWETVLPGICVLDTNDDFCDSAELQKTQLTPSLPDSLQFACFTSKNANVSSIDQISKGLQHTNLDISYLALLVLGKECALDILTDQQANQANYAVTDDFLGNGIDDNKYNDNAFDWWEQVNSHAHSKYDGGFVFMYQNLVSGRCKITDRNGVIILDGKRKQPLCGNCNDMIKKFKDFEIEVDILNYTGKGRMDAETFWDHPYIHEGPYKLEKHKIFKNHCRIIEDGSKRCIASGTSNKIEGLFQQVIKQWNELKTSPKDGAGRWDESKEIIRDNCYWKNATIKHENKKERKERAQRNDVWKIEKHCQTGYCRIITPAGVCVFAGDLENARRKYEEYKDKQNIFFHSLLKLELITIWHIPGWKNNDVQEIQKAYRILFPNCHLEIKTWDNMNAFDISSKKADRFAKTLIAEIQGMSPKERETLTIVGHSLGGRIATRIAAELRRLDLPIKNICILGAALPCIDKDVRLALETGETCKDMTVIHIYNPRDKALKGLFQNFSNEGGEAMGCHKYYELGKSIHQFEVTWNNIQDANKNWDFINGILDHNYLNYLIRLKKIVDLSQGAFK